MEEESNQKHRRERKEWKDNDGDERGYKMNRRERKRQEQEKYN